MMKVAKSTSNSQHRIINIQKFTFGSEWKIGGWMSSVGCSMFV